MFLRSAVSILVAVAALWLAGCATPPSSTTADTRPLVTCYVCEYNHDLGCVCFRLKESTPHLAYQGKEYYFCSDDCCQAFQRKPAKYISGHDRK